jgi:hypothetical protein
MDKRLIKTGRRSAAFCSACTRQQHKHPAHTYDGSYDSSAEDIFSAKDSGDERPAETATADDDIYACNICYNILFFTLRPGPLLARQHDIDGIAPIPHKKSA